MCRVTLPCVVGCLEGSMWAHWPTGARMRSPLWGTQTHTHTHARALTQSHIHWSDSMVYYSRSRSVNTSRSVILRNQTYATCSKPFVWVKHTLCVRICQDNLTVSVPLTLCSRNLPPAITTPWNKTHTFHLLYHAQVAHFQAMMSWSMCQAFRWLSMPSITTATKTQHIHVHPYMSV